MKTRQGLVSTAGPGDFPEAVPCYSISPGVSLTGVKGRSGVVKREREKNKGKEKTDDPK